MPVQSAVPRPKIGPYELEAPIGLGSTGRVYRAMGPRGRVAIKVPRTQAMRNLVKAEADLLNRCAHPHLVRCVDHHPAGAWLATELVQGEPITTFTRHAPVEETIRLGLELLAPIKHLHALDVVHGDIQPTNILVDTWGHPKLLDLGAGLANARHGTLGYFAPERLLGKPATIPTDVYGLGATLYTALTHHAPFEADEPSALATLPLQSAPLPASSWRVDIPVKLDRLLLEMLARDPRQRPSLSKVERALVRMHHSAPTRPVVGMATTRRALRREAHRALEGEPVVIVLYGPAGSGRRTLAQDLVRHARREGLEFVERMSSAELARVHDRGGIPVAVSRSGRANSLAAALEVIDRKAPCLLLFYGGHPITSLAFAGATHMMPSPLDLHATRMLAEWLGAPHDIAHDIWRRTEGHPRSVWLALEPHATRNTGDRAPFSLPQSAGRILAALRDKHGVMQVDVLAAMVQLPPQVLLDHCAMLQACGLVQTERGGRTIRATEAERSRLR